MLNRLLRVPRPLLVLTLAVLCHNIAWVVALPAWQGPDESSHYAYVERLAADHSLMRFDHENALPANSQAVNASLDGHGPERSPLPALAAALRRGGR